MNLYLCIGRYCHGENDAYPVEAQNFDEAAKIAATAILEDCHPDFNDQIYIDFVILKNNEPHFKYHDNYVFDVDDLR